MRLFWHSGVLVTSAALPLLVAFLTVPHILAEMGVGPFGLLTLAWTLFSSTGILDLGLSRALTRRIAELDADSRQTSATIWVGLTTLAGIGLTISAGLLLLGPWLLRGVAATAGSVEVRNSLVLLAATLPLALVGAGLRGLLEGRSRFGVVAMARLCVGLVPPLSPLAVLPFTDRLDALVAILCLGRGAGVAVLALAARRWLPMMPPTWPEARAEWMRIVNFGSGLSVTNLAGMALSQVDRFVIAGSPLGSSLAYYTTPGEIVTKAALIPFSLMTVLFPRIARSATLDRDNVQALRMGWGLTVVGVAPLMAAVCFFAQPFLEWWIGEEFASRAGPILQALAVGTFFNSLALVPQMFLLGHGCTWWLAGLYVAELFLYLPWLWWTVQQWGLIGVAWASMARAAADAVVLFLSILLGWRNAKNIALPLLSGALAWTASIFFFVSDGSGEEMSRSIFCAIHVAIAVLFGLWLLRLPEPSNGCRA